MENSISDDGRYSIASAAIRLLSTVRGAVATRYSRRARLTSASGRYFSLYRTDASPEPCQEAQLCPHHSANRARTFAACGVFDLFTNLQRGLGAFHRAPAFAQFVQCQRHIPQRDAFAAPVADLAFDDKACP